MQQASRIPTGQHGFSLIELMVAVVVAAILAAIALPSYQNYIARQRISAAQADLTALALSLDGYLLNNTGYPGVTQGTAAIRTTLSGWSPVQAMDFNYAIVAVNNTAFPPSYTVRATGTSNFVKGCILELSSAGSRTKTACPGSQNQW